MSRRQSLLWKVFYDNKFKGYLFGTMHVPSKVAFSNFDKLHDYILACEWFGAEMNMDQESLNSLNTYLFLPENKLISDYLSPRKFDKYRKTLLKSMSLDLLELNRFLPMVVFQFLTEAVLNENQQSEPIIDYELWQYADLNNKRLTGLESFESHSNVLSLIPLDFQFRLFNKTLSNIPKFRREVRQLLKYYKNQNIHQLYRYSKKMPNFILEILLYNRNVEIVKTLEREWQLGEGFATFGAGHLSGEQGILHILNVKGYTLKPENIFEKSKMF